MSTLSQLSQHLKFPLTAEKQLQAQRLFHGRGHAYDGLYHVTVDWLPPVILITLFAPESPTELDGLADWLVSQIPSCKSIQIQYRYELTGPIDVIRGDVIRNFAIRENELHFYISLGSSRNTGLFLDMQNGRKWVQAHSNDKRVLNLFSYTCGFSVAALAGNAKSVLNVDMSSAALYVGRKNHKLNQQPLEQVRFEKLNIFKSFGRLKKRGPFDLLICDPPTFQKGSVDIIRDYPKILRRLDEFMAAGSTLLLCLNAPEIGRDFLIKHMAELAPQYTLMEEIKPPEVYAEVEGKGLKVLYFKSFRDLKSA
ncbi:MAG: class I SAM-dependent methyltransferase [Methylococcaceae bacterium]|nr:class I SAM-dependent methyltransferase [Methylococcaceae bacterium]